MSNLLDDISTYLDVENSITARWLASALRIDLSKARSALEKYKEANSTVTVSYLLTGLTANKTLSFVVANEFELDAVGATLDQVRSKEIYAIHKVKSITNKAEIQALEYEQASEILLMGHPNSQEFISNAGGHITCPSIEVKNIGQRILSSAYVPIQAKESINAIVTKTVAEKAVAPAVVLKSKSSIQATNFFGAAKTAPAKASTAGTAAVKSEPTPAANSAVPAVVVAPVVEDVSKELPAKRVGKIAIDDDEDEEWDSGYKPNPERLKQRIDATAPTRRDEVSETPAEEEVVEEDDGVDTSGAGGKKKGRGKVMLHGAMDDYMEDVAIAEHKFAQAHPDAVKPKKRKLVEKMFADEKGYLVTEMIWEEVTDDEDESSAPLAASVPAAKRPKEGESAPAATLKEKKAPAKTAAAGGKKSAASDASKPQQKSMMSFFGKKA